MFFLYIKALVEVNYWKLPNYVLIVCVYFYSWKHILEHSEISIMLEKNNETTHKLNNN
jgi:hypothetical protein